MKLILCLTLALILATPACHTPKASAFAPLSARLEPAPGGAAQYFVLTNSSGQELHNFRCSVYAYSELLRRHPFVRRVPIRQFIVSDCRIKIGQVMRFRPHDKLIQDSI